MLNIVKYKKQDLRGDFMYKEKILICDDSALARRSLKTQLQEIGYENIIEADDGETAVTTYKDQKPDVVFLDIVMPAKDGIQVVEEIIACNPDARIIMFSSVGTQTNLRTALEKGACEFLQKPAKTEDIKNILSKLIGG